MCVLRAILVAEDDDNDFLLISRALKEAGFLGKILRAEDGNEAIDKLKHAGNGGEMELPAVALIDLKMPRGDGFDVLKWKRRHLELPCVPIIIFSSSSMEGDVKQAYALGANAFTMKPNRYDQYVDYCASLQNWWRRCEFNEV